MTKVAIVGGGPGGLIAAYLLEGKCKDSCQTTLFEASDRIGGKVLTRCFDSAPVIYEAGVAELYDYRRIGPDPLRQLVTGFDLKTVPMHGQTVVLEGRILGNKREIKQLCGEATLKAIEEFLRRGAEAMSFERWYEGYWQEDNKHPWARRSCEEMLDEVSDTMARKYLKVAVHSDLATEPHLTNGLNGLKNFLMDVPGYIRLYSIEGGIELLPKALKEHLSRTRIELNCPVVRVEKDPSGTYRIAYRRGREVEQDDFDAVIIALPHNWLGAVEWGGERLRKAMNRHIAYYDRPAHYLRISALFEEPFWRRLLRGSWSMLDAFGGCCLYDESSRQDCGKYGALGWLLAGNDALCLSNFDDQTLIDSAMDSLPESLQDEAHQLLIEAKVHRWLASVNAQPGGYPARDTRSAHLPEPKDHPALFIVGDYLFDSTLNGVMDSADLATDLLEAWMKKQLLLSLATGSPDAEQHTQNGCRPHDGLLAKAAKRFSDTSRNNPAHPHGNPKRNAFTPKKSKVEGDYFRHYYGHLPYQESHGDCFDANYIKGLISIAWKTDPPYRLLEASSVTDLTLADFSDHGVDVWGVEKNRYVQSLTPGEVKRGNLLGDVRKLPFSDNYFDFVYETSLAYVPERQVAGAIKELHRITRRGVIFGGITSDVDPHMFKSRDLLRSMKTLLTLWEWGDLFMANGFKLTVGDKRTLAALWRHERKYNGDDAWYPHKESLSYLFYTKIPDNRPGTTSDLPAR